MIGSDWPVSTLRAPLRAELSALVALLGPLSDAEREQVLVSTAADSYGLIA